MLRPLFLALPCSKTVPTNTWEAPLWHSKTCRCSLACLPAPSPLPLLPPWQKAVVLLRGCTESNQAEGNSPSLMKSGKGLSVSALSLPVGGRGWRGVL